MVKVVEHDGTMSLSYSQQEIQQGVKFKQRLECLVGQDSVGNVLEGVLLESYGVPLEPKRQSTSCQMLVCAI